MECSSRNPSSERRRGEGQAQQLGPSKVSTSPGLGAGVPVLCLPVASPALQAVPGLLMLPEGSRRLRKLTELLRVGSRACAWNTG